MATSLQQQLAVINAKSTDQLNLKAQKARHSQSLLFEAREAASQSFDTLFQLCQEGFAELCQLDRRYAAFAQNLFAESSVSVDREQMTAAENKELAVVIEQFLGLVSGKLLLRPAQKSLEWLVRRWRIHEYNTTTMLYAFVPYHGHEIFATVLSILPKKIPHEFTFLRPYIASLQCPPRHALVSAAVSNTSFITAYSTFVLSVSKRSLQSSILVGSWVSILAQSLNARLDSAQSGRDEIRRQRSEDVLLSVLPTVQEMLAFGDVQDLFLAACMIITILATKVELADTVLDALMDSVATSWTEDTSSDGIECLAVLAEEKSNTIIPKVAFNTIIKSETAVSAILALNGRLRVDNLIAGLLQRYLSSPQTSSDAQSTEIVTELMQHAIDTGMLSASLRQKLSAMKEMHTAPSSLRLLLDRIADNYKESEAADVDMQDADDLALLEEPLMEIDDEEKAETLIQALPSLPHDNFSFLDPAAYKDDIFSDYLSCFEKCHASEALRKDFLDVPALHANRLGSQPETLSFLARCWSSAGRYNLRRSALQIATELLHANTNSAAIDLQALYPYALLALADGFAPVRKAAAQLASQLHRSCKKLRDDATRWAGSTIYGSASSSIIWLNTNTASAFLTQTIEPRLEECVLDQRVVRNALISFLNESKIKSSTRSAICNFITSHATLSSETNVQLTLFGILQDVGKAATDSRVEILIPFVQREAKRPSLVLEAALQTLSHRTSDEIEALKQLTDEVPALAYKRLSEVFGRCKQEIQNSIVSWLFARAISDGQESDTEALRTLRNIRLPVDTLVHLLQLTAGRSADTDRPSKRQRLGKGLADKAMSSPHGLDSAMKRASLCLEVVEDSLADTTRRVDDQHHSLLVKQLFNLLGEVQTWRAATGSELTYLQVLTLNNILAVLNISDAKAIDHSYLRTDMIVETLRSTSSPQVHNSALLVISKIATFAPDAVLHSVMPLFTFMSSSTLRQADAYSIHVINMTIESIVPPLRESLKARGKDLVAGASDLLLSFTAAFEHVPGHRRNDTFVQLLRVLGPDDALYAVLAMLVERYSEDNTLLGTLQGILNSFPARTQMHALAQYLDLVADACKKRKNLADNILGFAEKNAAEANRSVATLLDGWAGLVSSSSLRSRIRSELNNGDAKTTLDAYSRLLEKLVTLPRLQNNVAKFDEPTLRSAHDVALQALLALLPTKEFIASSAELMQAGSEQVRVKVFTSLAQRVNDAKTNDIELVKVLVEQLPNCSVFISVSQPIAVRMSAIACVDAICSQFGKQNRQAVRELSEVLVGPAALDSDAAVLQSASLLCFAGFVEILGSEFTAIAPRVSNLALAHIRSALGFKPCNWQLVDAGFSLLNAVLDYEAWLLDDDTLGQALCLACQTQQLDETRSWATSQFCKLVPAKIALNALCAQLQRTFDEITQLGNTAKLHRDTMLKSAVDGGSRAAINTNADELFSLILRSLSLRGAFSTDEDTELQNNDIVIEAALDMTMKMSPTAFGPLYLRFIEWAEDTSDGPESTLGRLRALWDFSLRFFDRLGSIVTNYASFVVDNANAILHGKFKMNDHEGWYKLVNTLLRALQTSFRHDQDDFWAAPKHFDSVANSVLRLLVEPLQDGINIVNETIVELATNVAGSSEHLKSINTQILSALRHESPAIRLAAVKCERKITERLTLDWLNLLPEMIPYISELLEDMDESVEREVLRWVAQIEEITGESLEALLA